MSISPRRRVRGMTLIELVLAIVVIGVGLAGVLVAFNQAVFGSADPMIRKQMLSIAEEMMEEITLKPFAAGAAVPPAGCARSTHDDVADYNGYASVGICDIDGTAIPSLATYNVAVTVTATAMPNGIAAADAFQIVVTVTHGTETLTLVGYRTRWA
ncbi:MAG: prepilin-type N-terminal cleavage/methylation domain-containing protein [Gammaproteobacteria bacterium]|nr:prepilin-type N-terminal cleavage/methylation domain-containing protein [Gammaproteobacteria bacterium]MBU1416502.1 prepilin-type N-terminal cleavage/methylation domain-containing protein [Gammaproteobacteria bacterium]